MLLYAFLDVFLHIDARLAEVIAHFGPLTYAILFLVIFCETGLVFTPFLPGDSLLFAAGAFAARGSLNPFLLTILLWIAAVLGDTCNYKLGSILGRRVFKPNRRFLSLDHLHATEAFYARHGAKAVLFARFLPMFRTIAPFVAGIGKMEYAKFLFYNVVGATVWVLFFVWGGYFFGQLPAVEKNFSVVILAIIVISVVPGVIHAIRHWWGKRGMQGGKSPSTKHQ